MHRRRWLNPVDTKNLQKPKKWFFLKKTRFFHFFSFFFKKPREAYIKYGLLGVFDKKVEKNEKIAIFFKKSTF